MRRFHLPEIGLRGAGILFDPSSLCLFSLDYQKAFGFLETIPVSEQEDGRVSAPINQEEASQSATLAHEQDHFLRMLSTSYGYLRYGLDVVMTFFFLETSQAAIQANCPNIFPLCQSYKGGLSDFPKPYDMNPSAVMALRQDEHFRQLLHLLALEDFQRALDGVSPLCDAKMSVFGARLFDGFLQQKSRISADLIQPKSPFLQPFFSSTSAAPLIQKKPFGAFILLECLGYLMEVQISSAFHGKEEELNEKLKDHRYRSVYEIFAKQVLRKKPYSGAGFPIEFEAAVELSLWVPWGPRGTFVSDWVDIQPGWRYLKILEYLANSSQQWTEPQRDDFASIDAAMIEIQNHLCDALGWPTPSVLIDAWLEAETVGIPLPVIHKEHPRRRFIHSMLEWRRHSPFKLYLNDERAFGNPQAISFPVFVCEDIDVTLDSNAWKNQQGQAMNWVDFSTFSGVRAFHHGLDKHLSLSDRHMDGMVKAMLAMLQAANEDPIPLERVLRSYIKTEFPYLF